MSYTTGILGSMSDTAARLLGLLSLLQRPRDWPGSELAERRRVSPRTIRRDIQRLRDLGYPVQAAMGAVGGYRLVAGTAMPPLLLDDEEAVAIAVGLRTAASHAIDGIEEASLQALAKLDQVLPSRLRNRVRALSAATIPLPAWHETPTVDPERLTALAAAVADHQQLRFGYRAADGTRSRRLAEPHRLVAARHRWYLVAYDNDRHDWRVFRVDRMREPQPTGLRAGPRELPEKDVATYLTRKALATAPVYRAVATLHAPAEQVAARLGDIPYELEPIDERTCRLHSHADTLEWLASRLIMLGCEFQVHEPPELAKYLRALGARVTRAAGDLP
jgi:predicted DNA-binding transcriptional regulator YafY